MAIGPSGEQKTPRKWHKWKVGALAVAAGAAYLLQDIPGAPTWAAWITRGLGVVLTIGALTANHYENKRNAASLLQAEEIAKQAGEIAKEARQAAVLATHGLIKAGIDGLNQMAGETTASGRAQKKERMKQLIVDLAAQIGPSARACFFSLQGTVPNRTLQWDQVWKAGEGRHLQPRKEFVEGDKGAGDDMLKMIDDGTYRLVENTDACPRGWFVGEQEYQTYIAVPVSSNDQNFGFIGLDSPSVGDLTSADLRTMRLLATILATALVLGAKPPKKNPVVKQKAKPDSVSGVTNAQT